MDVEVSVFWEMRDILQTLVDGVEIAESTVQASVIADAMAARDDMDTYYNVFVRNWWRRGSHGERVPGPGPKTYTRKHVTYADARDLCKQYNDTHNPGFLSRKAEFEEA